MIFRTFTFLHTFRWAAALLLMLALARSADLCAQTLYEEVCECVRERIEETGSRTVIKVGKERIHASTALPRFYEERTYRAAWTNEAGPVPQAGALVKALRGAHRDGLSPGDYHLEKIERLLNTARADLEAGRSLDPQRLVDLDLLLTDAFLVYGDHLAGGRVNPETIDPEWQVNGRKEDLAALLESAVAGDRIEQALNGLLPKNPGYDRLRQVLARYRELAGNGGWPAIPGGAAMKMGDRGDRVAALRKRLLASGDLSGPPESPEESFGEKLEGAVRRYQRRNGLVVDGIAGREALTTLNVSTEDRLLQIEANLERWRWLPRELGDRYVLVNIADFSLEVVDGGRPALSMRVIIGLPFRKTPVFSDTITYLVLNPAWNIPSTIALEDKLPLIAGDPGYLERNRIVVLEGWGEKEREVDPGTIEWSTFEGKKFPYRLRQKPGPDNALGRIKFMFPNKFDVYLHDTPSRELFTRNKRTFSSGCIRAEDPVGLAEFLLRGDPLWPRAKIEAAIENGETLTVGLPAPTPIHLLYWTAWVDGEGILHLREDVYGRDEPLKNALRRPPPLSS